MPRAVKVARMSAWSITLRLVLMLALALNGMASVVAGVLVAAAPDEVMQASVDVAATGSGSPGSTNCHGDAMDGLAAGQHVHAHAASGALDPDRHPIPDGCQVGACQCACTHCTQFPAPVMAVAQSMFGCPGNMGIATADYPVPALSSLIRPPIV